MREGTGVVFVLATGKSTQQQHNADRNVSSGQTGLREQCGGAPKCSSWQLEEVNSNSTATATSTGTKKLGQPGLRQQCREGTGVVFVQRLEIQLT
jgi:uncharacterized protein (AIM24 family)